MATDKEPREKTFEELRAERAAEWKTNQSAAAKDQAALHDTIMKMPDVQNAPSSDIPWQHSGIICRICANLTFMVTRAVTVNGVKHRYELKCQACEVSGTWDWTAKRWVEDMLKDEKR